MKLDLLSSQLDNKDQQISPMTNEETRRLAGLVAKTRALFESSSTINSQTTVVPHMFKPANKQPQKFISTYHTPIVSTTIDDKENDATTYSNISKIKRQLNINNSSNNNSSNANETSTLTIMRPSFIRIKKNLTTASNSNEQDNTRVKPNQIILNTITPSTNSSCLVSSSSSSSSSTSSTSHPINHESLWSTTSHDSTKEFNLPKSVREAKKCFEMLNNTRTQPQPVKSTQNTDIYRKKAFNSSFFPTNNTTSNTTTTTTIIPNSNKFGIANSNCVNRVGSSVKAGSVSEIISLFSSSNSNSSFNKQNNVNVNSKQRTFNNFSNSQTAQLSSVASSSSASSSCQSTPRSSSINMTHRVMLANGGQHNDFSPESSLKGDTTEPTRNSTTTTHHFNMSGLKLTNVTDKIKKLESSTATNTTSSKRLTSSSSSSSSSSDSNNVNQINEEDTLLAKETTKSASSSSSASSFSSLNANQNMRSIYSYKTHSSALQLERFQQNQISKSLDDQQASPTTMTHVTDSHLTTNNNNKFSQSPKFLQLFQKQQQQNSPPQHDQMVTTVVVTCNEKCSEEKVEDIIKDNEVRKYDDSGIKSILRKPTTMNVISSSPRSSTSSARSASSSPSTTSPSFEPHQDADVLSSVKVDSSSCVLPSKLKHRTHSLAAVDNDEKPLTSTTRNILGNNNFVKNTTKVYSSFSNNNLAPKRIVNTNMTRSSANASANSAKEALLRWCRHKTESYDNVAITNFSSSWSNGLAFCALLHSFMPDLFDYSELNPNNARYNFDLAFRLAEEKAGIVSLLDVDDMIEMGSSPDWKCVFTYVHSIYQRFKEVQSL